MPRNERREMKRSDSRMGAFGLRLIGSLIYLGVVLFAASSLAVSAAVWQPLLYAAAVVGAVVLFFTNFGSFGAFGNFAARSSLTAAVVAGFSLIALTAGQTLLFLVVIIGFIFSFVGSGLEYKYLD